MFQRAHHTFLEDTDDEIKQLCCAATLLDLDLDLVAQVADTYRTIADTVALVP